MWIKQRTFDKKTQEFTIKLVWLEPETIKEADLVAEQTSVAKLNDPALKTIPVSYSGATEVPKVEAKPKRGRKK